MKRFVPVIAVLLPLFFLAACGPSKNQEATITASPNSVSVGEGPGTTTVTWNTGDGTAGQVYVSADRDPEVLFAAGASGSSVAPWIKAPYHTFEFRLYAGNEHAKLLGKTQVTVTGLK